LLFSDVIRLSFKALTEKKLRAVLTIIGIAIGPLALVMIHGVTRGYGHYITQQLSGLGQHLVVVFPEQGTRLGEKDLETLRSIPGVVDASPFYSTQGKLKRGSEEITVYIYSARLDFLFKAIPSLEVLEGSIPSETDIVKCLAGYNIAFDDYDNRVYSTGDALAVTIYRVSEGRVREQRAVFIVSGVLKKYGGAAILNPDATIFTSLEAGERVLGFREWAGILLYVEDLSLISNVTSAIRELYGGSVSVTSFYAIAQIAQSITGAVEFMTFSASLAAFAVAVAGVAATMITSVIERTREIGVLKALGFTDMQVLILVLFEGIVMSLIGGAIGMATGVFGAHLLASQGLVIRAGVFTVTVKAPPDLSLQLFATTIAVTIAVGVLGAIFPAYRAAKIPPAVALRYE